MNNSRRRYLQKRFGITPETYDALFVAQGGVCAICKQKNKGGQRLAVDHRHSDSKVRGLLCCTCNLGVGVIEQSPDWLIRALDYLRARSG